MTSITLESKSTPDAKFVTVVSEELPLERAYREDAFQRLVGTEEFRAVLELTDIDTPRPGVAFIQDVVPPESPEGVRFNGTVELSFNVRNYFLPRPRYSQSFANIPAFRIWADRQESDDELLERLGSQWGGDEIE